MAKTKANSELLERVVVGPKPLHCTDYETGVRFIAAVGDTVFLTPQHAKSKARYLQAPAVAKALANARKAEEAEAEKESPEIKISAAPSGGDSAES